MNGDFLALSWQGLVVDYDDSLYSMLKKINNEKREVQTRCLPPAPWDRHPLQVLGAGQLPCGCGRERLYNASLAKETIKGNPSRASSYIMRTPHRTELTGADLLGGTCFLSL